MSKMKQGAKSLFWKNRKDNKQLEIEELNRTWEQKIVRFGYILNLK